MLSILFAIHAIAKDKIEEQIEFLHAHDNIPVKGISFYQNLLDNSINADYIGYSQLKKEYGIIIEKYCNEKIAEIKLRENKQYEKNKFELELLQSNIESNDSNNEHRRFITIITLINVSATILTLLLLLWRELKH